MIQNGFLRHNDVLIMDNAKIHTSKEAEIIEDLLWECKIAGRPLRILTVFLPTRSPELNPIELIFHILSRRIKSFRCEGGGPTDQAVIKETINILNNISFDLVICCMLHCGYSF